MTITLTYPNSGHTRVHHQLTQIQVNKMITNLSEMNEEVYVPVHITVTEDKRFIH